MHLVKLRSKNQITLPGKVVARAGLKEGDLLNVAADGTRIVITAQEVRERGAGYTMTDLLGAASGVYGSVEEIDAEIDAEIAGGRAPTFLTNDQRLARVGRLRVLTLARPNDPPC